MQAFQGISYRCVFEEEPKKTASAITLACMDLQPSEYVYVVASTHMIDTKYETENQELSYTNGCVSEYLGCQIFKSIGIPVQETLLGTYTKNGKEKIFKKHTYINNNFRYIIYISKFISY